ncbi:MAG: tetratricopeptide repeat protein [Bacteroidota bacterium]
MNPQEQFNTAIQAYQSGRLDEAISTLSALIDEFPDFLDALLILGVIQAGKGNFEAAVDAFKKTIALAPERGDLYFNLGNVYLQSGNPVKARETYLKVLELQPDFIPALINIGHILSDEGHADKAEIYYQKAVSLQPKQPEALTALAKFKLDKGLNHQAIELLKTAINVAPENVTALVLLGNAMKETRQFDAAESLYRQALKHDPSNQGAAQNLRRLLSNSIPKWHFTMLADERRNEAYDQALRNAISNDDTVLDIGTGSGLLAMMAARAGATKVYACEMHTKLANLAEQVISDNGFSEKIKVINKKSTDLDIGADLDKKVSVLVSEILDVGAVGEGVVHVIRHAVKNLTTENVKIIPSEVELFGQLIEIPSRSRVNPVKTISGFDLSAFNLFSVPEEYTSVNLETEFYRVLTDTIPLISYNFYQLPPAIQDNQPQVKELEFSAKETGNVQAIVFWFDLALDKEITVSSKPGGELKHWGQALFCFPEPLSVNPGKKVTVKMIHSDHLIQFAL